MGGVFREQRSTDVVRQDHPPQRLKRDRRRLDLVLDRPRGASADGSNDLPQQFAEPNCVAPAIPDDTWLR